MAQAPVRSLKAGVNKFQGPTVTIMVGPSKKPFYESEEHTFELPEDDPQIFALYSHWLYVGQIPVIVQSATQEDAANNNYKEYYDLVKAYVLGDKLLDVKFQNSTIQAIVEKSATPGADGQRHYPGAGTVIHAYDNTAESAKIRNLFVDIYVEIGGPRWLTKELPKDFLYSVVEGLMKKRASPPKPIEASHYFLRPSGS
ncbi:hypothetical protein N7449_007738 [Penicillium cf. viridicatum]|uniref:BTB domain-containing protein n=1 Tax=Penicillium cf. viridicatum TaxID=2972119 RepID=A0A9W9MCZ0_9EURO|nr:hypothetical protein N7449_007738 [Penicillium cf. viridicatum]